MGTFSFPDFLVFIRQRKHQSLINRDDRQVLIFFITVDDLSALTILQEGQELQWMDGRSEINGMTYIFLSRFLRRDLTIMNLSFNCSR